MAQARKAGRELQETKMDPDHAYTEDGGIASPDLLLASAVSVDILDLSFNALGVTCWHVQNAAESLGSHDRSHCFPSIYYQRSVAEPGC